MIYFNDNFHFALIWRSGRDRSKPVTFKAQEMVIPFMEEGDMSLRMKEDHEGRLSLLQNGNGVFYYYSREWRNNDGGRVKDKKSRIIIDSQ